MGPCSSSSSSASSAKVEKFILKVDRVKFDALEKNECLFCLFINKKKKWEQKIVSFDVPNVEGEISLRKEDLQKVKNMN